MSLSRQLIEEAIRFNQPVAFLADTGRGNLKGIGPVRMFATTSFEEVCDLMVRFLDRLHGLGIDFKDEYDPVQKLDQLVSFYRLAAFFIGAGPRGSMTDTMLCVTDRPTLSNETREWIFQRLDPNQRDPINWYRSLDGESRQITYDHVVFAKSRPQHIGMPALDEPIEVEVPDEESRGFGRAGRRLRRS